MCGKKDDNAGLKTASPCISVCEMNDITGLCKGCFRTIDEIIDWTLFTAEEKDNVNSQVNQRRTLKLR